VLANDKTGVLITWLNRGKLMSGFLLAHSASAICLSRQGAGGWGVCTIDC